MRKYYSIFLIFFTVAVLSSSAQPEKDVTAAVESLMKGIVNSDKTLLEDFTAEGLVYGHSSGKVQNRAEFIEEVMISKPLDFVKIDLLEQTVKIVGNAAVVRHVLSAEITNNGAPGSLKIGNMLVLQKQKGKWKLIARQAYKL